MTEYRLKIKIGDHEFEAEGPVEAVKQQFETFKELIAKIPERISDGLSPIDASASSPPVSHTLYVDRILKADKRVVSILVPPSTDTEAVLLILYGQKHFRSNEAPTGSEVMDGMIVSGYRTSRVDRIMSNLRDEGLVMISGTHRGKRYRLSNVGATRAEAIIRDALARLPA